MLYDAFLNNDKPEYVQQIDEQVRDTAQQMLEALDVLERDMTLQGKYALALQFIHQFSISRDDAPPDWERDDGFEALQKEFWRELQNVFDAAELGSSRAVGPEALPRSPRGSGDRMELGRPGRPTCAL